MSIPSIFDIKAHWERIYQETLPQELSWYQQKPSLSLELIRHSEIDYNAPIIDVGGGSSVLADFLLKQGYKNLAVLDVSEKSLAYAKGRLGDIAHVVEWFECDVARFKAPHAFTLWHDRAVFHFLTQKRDRMNYVKVLKETLSPGGHLILAAFAVGGPTRCSGLDVVQYDAVKLMEELGNDFELAEEKGEVHYTPANKTQQFMYFRCIRV